MTMLEIDEVDSEPAASAVAEFAPAPSIRVHGKFFFAGARKHFVKGVTYGPFAPSEDEEGAQFPPRAVVARDFALMAGAGVNTVRVFTVPPLWLLDAAERAGLKLLVGLPWTQHVSFLDAPEMQARIRESVGEGVRACACHPAVFAYLVGNEIPPDMVRWHGAEPVRRFLKSLVARVKSEHPGALVSYANFPTTEYLTIDFTDFVCFNVYLHDEAAFRGYLARLHNLAPDRPLVLSEFGLDSYREGEKRQSETLSSHLFTAFQSGLAGTFVFSWTDEWFTGGHRIEDWAFGLVDRERRPKPALSAVAERYTGILPPPLPRTPRVSVVVCAYNAERTLDPCLSSLAVLNYPDYEVILVNDGSRDRTLAIAERHGFCRIISQPNKGLSVARNVGAEAATGEIVAYTDSDCVADPDWLTYLVARMEAGGLSACGGPNFPPPEPSLVPAAVAVSPGGPTHVLLSDEVAEHIAGCNMAFRRDALLRLGGFDPVYRAAGDDVDICWRFQDAGYTIGFSPAAIVWHFRRNTVRAYINQQRGYGKAEALVYSKHPLRFNLFGQAKWLGRIYGDLSAALLFSRKPVIYSGPFGRGLFQTLYEPPSSLTALLPLTFEWSAAALALALGGIIGGGWWWLLTAPLIVTWALSINGARKAPLDPRFAGLKARALVAFLIYLAPLARGWERTRWRLREMRRPQRIRPIAPEGTSGRARLVWARRAFDLSYWSESGAEKEVLLGGIMAFLKPQKYFVMPDTGWSAWDLQIARGLWSRATLLVCAEDHGSGRRLLRVRVAMRLSGLARALLRLYAALAALALMLALPWVAAALGVLGAANLAVMGYHLVAFGRVMRRVVAIVAEGARLTPLAAAARSARAEAAPRPA